ncbi:MAG TPA: DUF899 family protein [Thermoanaerobaculia bacterium]|jgi:predicted dithiol-disulfide oxidoreductase (DUF899 family)|nr:DUF899 family protein [Thermoanaerobaculia bacterium]
MVRIQKEYVFEGPNGRANLRELFGGRRRLIVYHFSFDPAWDESFASCSHLADNLAGGIVHLPARDTSFAAVSRAPVAKIEGCKRRMGWTFPWLSSLGNTFNEDFHVTLDDGTEDERPGLSVFLREGGDVFHTYSTYQRGLDVLLGPDDAVEPTPPALLRRHDRYPPRQARR